MTTFDTNARLEPMTFALLANGIAIANHRNVSLLPNSRQYETLNVIGNGRYTSAATYFRLRFYDTQWVQPNLAMTVVSAEIDALLIGDPTPMLIHMGPEWPPNVSFGVLHWTKQNRVWHPIHNTPTDEYERFSLIAESV